VSVSCKVLVNIRKHLYQIYIFPGLKLTGVA
jgi:hypothetical protein